MRKKFFIMIFLLAGIMFIFSGCGWHCSENFGFKFKGEYMADKYVDLLIPLDETDEWYTPYNCNIEGDIKIPEDSEIVNYNKDGYRSMLMHIKKSKLNISMIDSENYYDSQEEYNGTPSEIRQYIYVPYYEDYQHYGDPYDNEKMFLDFCDKYKKCRAVVFDKDGNILQISKEIPLVSMGDFYLQDISYNVEKNRIKPYYIESASISYSIIELWLFAMIGTIGCIITLIVYKINQNGFIVSYKGYIIASSIFNIPAVLFIITCIYCVLGKALTIADFLKFLLFSVHIITGILIFFVFCEKQLRLKKQLEEKHLAESLDKSENM